MLDINEIKTNYAPETGLLILLCRYNFGTAGLAEINDYISNSNIDWQFFYMLVKEHDIRPLIYKVIIDTGITIPVDIAQRLRNNVLNLSTANIERFRELLQLQELFQKNDLVVIPVKGVVLSYLLYGDVASRETCDIDYFITPETFREVRSLLIEAGYKSESFYDEKLLNAIIANTREHKMFRETEHGIIKIELQWQVTLNNVDIPIKNADLLSNLKTIKVANHDIRVLSMQNRLMILMAHHGVNDIWRTLKHILDIGMLCGKYKDVIDWQLFQAESAKYKIRRTSQAGLLLSHQLFGTDLPVPVDNKVYSITRTVLKNLLKYPLIKRRRSFISNLGQQLSMRDSFGDKSSVLRAYFVFLIKPDIRDIELIRLNKRLHFIYFFLKPFRLIKDNVISRL